MIEYHSIQNILDLCKEQDKKIWEVVLQADMDESGASGEQIFEKNCVLCIGQCRRQTRVMRQI